MIDTHCHMDDPQYAENLEAYIAEQKAAGVEKILVPSVCMESTDSVRDICAQYPGYLFPAYGIHPEEIRGDYGEELARLRLFIEKELLRQDPLVPVAIGEIGLDYHFDTTYKEEQKQALRIQLDWALEWHLPVMIHSRDATEDTLLIMREYAQRGLRGVIHCFSGSAEVAKQYIDMGYYLGIGGILTFKNCKLADTLRHIPLDRLVLETDAPYMAPVPHRGQRNESRFIQFVIDKLVDIYGLLPADIDQRTSQNAENLFFFS